MDWLVARCALGGLFYPLIHCVPLPRQELRAGCRLLSRAARGELADQFHRLAVATAVFMGQTKSVGKPISRLTLVH
jgi:hypothetical protein